MAKRVGLITTSPEILKGEDIDLGIIVSALRDVSIAAEPLVWHEQNNDWSQFDLLIMRSPWDYPERLDEFLDWLHWVEREATILNSPRLIRWNLDKKYLLELEARGVDIVPTSIYDSVQAITDELTNTQAEVVIKPTVSVGSRNTGRYTPRHHKEALQLSSQILSLGKQVILQPCVENVSRNGEHSLIYFDGAFSHAIRKGPILADNGGYLGGAYTEDISPAKATPKEVMLADKAIKALASMSQDSLAPLYARFDIVTDRGSPLLLEAELFEPSYFLATAESSAQRFALAVKSRLGLHI